MPFECFGVNGFSCGELDPSLQTFRSFIGFLSNHENFQQTDSLDTEEGLRRENQRSEIGQAGGGSIKFLKRKSIIRRFNV
jgi:hypothetical protein